METMQPMQPLSEAPSARSYRKQSDYIETNVDSPQIQTNPLPLNNNMSLSSTKDRILETHVNFINQFKKTFELFSKNRIMMNEMKHKFMREIKKLI